MEIKEYIQQQYINLNLLSGEKEDAIGEIAQLLRDDPGVTDFELFLEDIFERERLGTTGIGDGIAIPHARSDGIGQLVIALGRSSRGVEFESLDGTGEFEGGERNGHGIMIHPDGSKQEGEFKNGEFLGQ